ncbi:MAG: LacI family DNA-binding transcriptional regulator [Deltaproteobacteria bacterium]|nr:LacI family DNA-binding transcriptional regulator [Deltaproteobacteria bacterium]
MQGNKGTIMMRESEDSRQRVTQQDIADYVGVSRATVSAVVNRTRYVSPELREKILAAIEELGYVPDIVARSMKTNRTMTIGLVLPNILSPIWATIARGVEDVARKAGFSTIFYDTDEQIERMKDGLRKLHEQRVDGVILAPCGNCADVVSQHMSRIGTPLVLVDRYLEDFELDTVFSDSETGTYEAIGHLLETGRRRVAIITLSLGISTGRDRLRGYERALKDHDMPIDAKLIVVGGRGEEEGYHGTRQLLMLPEEQQPDALFVSSHLMSIGALKAIREKDLQIPEDIAVIGFDDLPWMPLMASPLTVVSQPAYEMGAQAAEILMARLTEQEEKATQRIVLATRLVHRQSCCQLGLEPG